MHTNDADMVAKIVQDAQGACLASPVWLCECLTAGAVNADEWQHAANNHIPAHAARVQAGVGIDDSLAHVRVGVRGSASVTEAYVLAKQVVRQHAAFVACHTKMSFRRVLHVCGLRLASTTAWQISGGSGT